MSLSFMASILKQGVSGVALVMWANSPASTTKWGNQRTFLEKGT